MWRCRKCNVDLIYESIEQHTYYNHVRPVTGPIYIFNCGICMFSGESFEDIARHCVSRGHSPAASRDDQSSADLIFNYVHQMFLGLSVVLVKQPDNSASLPAPNRLYENDVDAAIVAQKKKTDSSTLVDDTKISHTPSIFEAVDQSIDWAEEIQGFGGQFIGTEAAGFQSRVKEFSDDWISANNIRSQLSGDHGAGSSNQLHEEEQQRTTANGSNITKVIEKREHKPVYECPYCPRLFTNEYKMLTCQYRHVGRKPFSCKICDKKFSDLHGVKRHYLLHTGQKPYKCLKCGNSFAHKFVLICHQRVHTQEKPYECKYCHAKFSRRATVYKHEKVIHENPKPPKKRIFIDSAVKN